VTVAFRVDRHTLGETLKAFDKFPRAFRNKNFRIALSAMAGIQRASASKFAPKQTKLLSKSLAIKVKVPAASFNKKHHSRPAYSVVGPNKNIVRASIVDRRGRTRLLTDKKALKHVLSGNKVIVRKPSRYAHLAENEGRKPSRFMSRASIKSQRAALYVAERKLKDAAEKEARRIAAEAAKPRMDVSIREVVR